MKISAHVPDERSLRATIILDGVRVMLAVTADEENGYVDVMRVVDGLTPLRNGSFIIDRLYGCVKITLSHQPYASQFLSRRKRRLAHRATQHVWHDDRGIAHMRKYK